MADNVLATHIATMHDDNVYRKTNARMFQSNFVEFFSKVHPAVPALMFVPVTIYFLWLAFQTESVWMIAAEMGIGLFFWSFTEYTLHRFYFHMTPNTPVKRFLFFYSHGIHHAYPDDYYRLVMVPIVSIPLAVGFYWLFRAALPMHMVAGTFVGMLVGYLSYDYIHFATHHVKPPRQTLLAPVAIVMKGQRRRHMKHHFEEHDTGYGVSTVFWDLIFRTQSKT
ncbi:MAG: sterol desaturase family protein [Sandaracinaceae bacterium]|nr:sterol desaturase family protein [Sandaracinaceae bacterium]